MLTIWTWVVEGDGSMHCSKLTWWGTPRGKPGGTLKWWRHFTWVLRIARACFTCLRSTRIQMSVLFPALRENTRSLRRLPFAAATRSSHGPLWRLPVLPTQVWLPRLFETRGLGEARSKWSRSRSNKMVGISWMAAGASLLRQAKAGSQLILAEVQ